MSDAADGLGRSFLDVRADMDIHPWELPADVAHGEIRSVGLLRDGAGPGRPSVAILAVVPGVGPVVVETTYKLAASAVAFLKNSRIATETT